jgi:hypothetical protein
MDNALSEINPKATPGTILASQTARLTVNLDANRRRSSTAPL